MSDVEITVEAPPVIEISVTASGPPGPQGLPGQDGEPGPPGPPGSGGGGGALQVETYTWAGATTQVVTLDTPAAGTQLTVVRASDGAVIHPGVTYQFASGLVVSATLTFSPAVSGLHYVYLDSSGGSTGGAGSTYVGPSTDNPDPAEYGFWVIDDDPDAYELRVSDGTQWLAIAGGGGTSGPTMQGPITFTTTGSTFAPEMWLVADSPSQIEWRNQINGLVVGTGPTPTIDFGSAGTRTIELWQTRPQDVLTLNLGYNSGDDTGYDLPGISGGAPTVDYQKAPGEAVTAISGLPLLTGLVNFMCANAPLAGTLDFTGLADLEFIECAYSRVQGVDLTGCASLIRLCLEQNNLNGATLDLNPVRGTLRDLRAAYQGGIVFAPLSGPMTALFHYCVRDQPVTNMFDAADMPVLGEWWTWNTGQSGTFQPPPAIRDARVYANGYTTLDMSLTSLQAQHIGQLALSQCPLTSIIGLAAGQHFQQLYFANCSLTQALVDQVLADINSWNENNGTLYMPGNAAPTGGASNTNLVALRARGWAVTLDGG
jgi:hypothetical protein